MFVIFIITIVLYLTLVKVQINDKTIVIKVTVYNWVDFPNTFIHTEANF